MATTFFPRRLLTSFVMSVMVAVALISVLGNWRADAAVSRSSVVAPVALPGGYVGLPPARVLDTRTGIGGFNGTPVGPGQDITVPVAGQGGVPASGAAAVLVNITVTAPTAAGYLTVYPHGGATPNASNLNFGPGQTIPNLVAATLGPDGAISIHNGSPGTVHVIADTAGYYTTGTPGPGGYAGLPPARVLDTRTGIGGFNGTPVGPGQDITVPVAGQGGVPASGAAAVLVNITVTAPTAAGYLTVYPHGGATPNASNLNFGPGQTIPNLVAATLGPDGAISIHNGSPGTVHVIADTAGYYTTGTPGPGGYAGLPPARVLDTRTGIGGFNGTPVGPGQDITVPVAGQGGVPASGAAAVLVNITVTAPTAAGYLTVYPHGGATPNASNLNFGPGQTIPNLVAATLGPDGAISIHNGSPGTVHVIADTAGYHTAPSGSAFATCETLDTLILGKAIVNGPPPSNSFQPPLMDIAAHPFTDANGTVTSSGLGQAVSQGKAGGSSVEIRLNNLTASINTGSNLSALRLAFGEYGGNINLWINDRFASFENFAAMNNTTLGGVNIHVPFGGNGNDQGVVEFTGSLNGQALNLSQGQLAIGGQELWIDNICFDKQ